MNDADPTTPLVPVVDDHDTAGFFEAAARGELAIRTCADCDSVLHVPVAYCRFCGSNATRWTATSGWGRLHSWTVVTHQVHASYPVPYTVVLVDLEDRASVRLVGRLPGRPELEAGQRMEVWFETLPGGVTIPQWRLSETTES